MIKYDIDKFMNIIKEWIIKNNIFDMYVIDWKYLKIKTDVILNNFKNSIERSCINRDINKDKKIINVNCENVSFQLVFLWFRFWYNEVYENELDVLFTHAIIDSFEIPNNIKWSGYF